MLAVTNNRIKCVEALLENGADPNIRSRVHIVYSYLLCPHTLLTLHIVYILRTEWLVLVVFSCQQRVHRDRHHHPVFLRHAQVKGKVLPTSIAAEY